MGCSHCGIQHLPEAGHATRGAVGAWLWLCLTTHQPRKADTSSRKPTVVTDHCILLTLAPQLPRLQW